MSHAVALLTPSHRADIERFELLCDSLDRNVVGYSRHYVIVNDSDISLFARFASKTRVVLPCSQLLPKWLWLLPAWLSRNGRRVWWSFRTPPVHGWHIQQLLKIGGAIALPEQRFCIVDSDNVFFRDFDVGAYAGGAKTPLYVDRGAISAEAPLHSAWMKSCDRLLSQTTTRFPADDFIGNLIVWDKDAVAAMTQTIEKAQRRTWQEALCRTRSFSEYLLYGRFVQSSPAYAETHQTVTESLAQAYWGEAPLNKAGVADMLRDASRRKVALCIESFSNTPLGLIRAAVELPPRVSPA